MDEEMEEEEMVGEEDCLKCLSGTSLQNASTGQKRCVFLCLQITSYPLPIELVQQEPPAGLSFPDEQPAKFTFYSTRNFGV